jgi:hypothetical protein
MFEGYAATRVLLVDEIANLLIHDVLSADWSR